MSALSNSYKLNSINKIAKSTLNNPNTSDEAKQNAQAMIEQLGGDQPREELYNLRGDATKDPNRVAGGLKAWVWYISWYLSGIEYLSSLL